MWYLLPMLALTFADENTPTRGKAVQEFQVLVQQAAASSDEDFQQNLKQLQTALRKMSPAIPVREQLDWVLDDSVIDPQKLKQQLQQVKEQLSFHPKLEAELPEGFPGLTPDGLMEIKTYPKHRQATGSGFMQLFMHIEASDIAMTVPVKIDYDAKPNGKLQQGDMSFYYSNMETGSVGRKILVRVSDAESEQVLSLGHRGRLASKELTEANRRLNQWLKDNPDYEAAGNVRMMAYSSPSVPTKNTFFEIQIPIRKK